MVTPEHAIEVVNELFGRHPGARALHAKGVFCTGSFTATPEAATLTRAAHMSGEPVPALIRFSHGSGHPRASDTSPTARGMAVRFTLPDGSHTVLSAQTARLFSSSTVEGFLAFVKAAKPSVSSLWRFPLLIARHPELLRTLRANRVALQTPVSYGTCGYHALHAFRWLDADGGSRFVRYHWWPEAGESFVSPIAARKLDRHFLSDELARRLDDGPVRFRLSVQIAGPRDSTVDPSAPWSSREQVEVGTLEVTGLAADPEADGGVVVFDPLQVTDGIEPSDDEILHFRSKSYSVSVDRRMS